MIEFFGLPGSGKTTIARRVAQELRERGVSCLTSWDLVGTDHDPWLFRQFKRMRMAGISLFFLPSVSWKASQVASRMRQRSFFDAVKVRWNLLVVLGIFVLAHRQRSKVCVLDQGLFQAFWSFCFASADPAGPGPWVEFSRSLDMSCFFLAHVRVSADTARSRLCSRRATSRAQREENLDDLKLWRRMQILDQEILQKAQALGGENRPGVIFEIDNEGNTSADVAAYAVAKKIFAEGGRVG